MDEIEPFKKSYFLAITLCTPISEFLTCRYRSDMPLTFGYRKGLVSVGSRVIPYKKSEPNMVEVECPLCTSTVDLGSNTTGTYECPYCHEDFEFEDDVMEDMMNLIQEIQEGSKECFIVYDHSHPPKLTLLFVLSCILTSFFLLPLFMLIERIMYQFTEKFHCQVIFLQETNSLLHYTITDSECHNHNELDLSEGLTISSKFTPAEGDSGSNSNEITIRDKSGNKIRFSGIGSNIVSFAKFMDCDIEGIGPYRYHKSSIEFKSNPEGRIGLHDGPTHFNWEQFG